MKTTNNNTNAQDKTYTILDLYNNKDKIYVTEDLMGNKYLCKLTDKGFYSKLMGNKEEAEWKEDYFTLNGILGLKFKEVPKLNLYRVKTGIAKPTIDCINLKGEEIEVGDLVVVTNGVLEGYGIVEEVVTDYEDTCDDYCTECFLEPSYAITHKNKEESLAKEEAYKALISNSYKRDRLSKIMEYLKKASHYSCCDCPYNEEGKCDSLVNCGYETSQDIITLAKKLDLPITDLLDCDEEQD